MSSGARSQTSKERLFDQFACLMKMVTDGKRQPVEIARTLQALVGNDQVQITPRGPRAHSQEMRLEEIRIFTLLGLVGNDESDVPGLEFKKRADQVKFARHPGLFFQNQDKIPESWRPFILTFPQADDDGVYCLVWKDRTREWKSYWRIYSKRFTSRHRVVVVEEASIVTS